jgi:aminoglycoside phosphotransferase (APT) family kinase protein
MNDAEVVGFDTSTIDNWLGSVTSVELPISWERLPGGHSNLTYLLTDSGGRELVIRRPPEGELLPKAHDMWREYRIIDGLWLTDVPVAEPIAYEDDRALAETHFYVMGKVDGAALYSGEEVAAWLPESARRTAGETFIDVLAALHRIDPEDVGLGRLGRPDSYVARQMATWHGSWMSSIHLADHDDPRVHELHEFLSSRIPLQGPTRVVHGDYSPHNCMFSTSGDLTAVLDWEIATLGEAMADLAYAMNAWVEPGDAGVYNVDPPTALPGFPTRQELTDRYAAATGADVSQLGFYRAYNYFKTGCILHGVFARYRAGQKSSEGIDLDTMFTRMVAAIDAAEATCAELD